MTDCLKTHTPLLTEPLSENEIRPERLVRGQQEAFARDVQRLQLRIGEFVEVPCPACQTSDSREKFTKYNFTFRSCCKCSTVYMSPRPSPEVMASYYSNSENYQYWAKHIFPASEASRKAKLHEPWFRKIMALCRNYCVPRQRLIEIGAGFGTFCQVAHESKEFDEVIAIEPTPEMARACRERGVRVLEKRIEDIGDEFDRADVVVSFEVIEHLFEPRCFIEQCLRILKPGGLLILSCPNSQGFDILSLGSLSGAVDPEHVNLFNPESIRILLEGGGFDVIETSTPGRLDAELVRDAAIRGQFDISSYPFLKRVLVDEWDKLGRPFQSFLAEHCLSSHMWTVSRKPNSLPASSTIVN